MSEQKTIDLVVREQRMRAKKRKIGKGALVTATDWSLSAGRIPHMNDPHVDQKVYKFVEQYTWDAVLTTSNAVQVAAGLSFTLSLLSDATDYTALFDQYRVDRCEFWIIPQSQALGSLMKSVVDYDNTTTTATNAYFDAYSNCHTTTLAQGHYRSFVPHIAIAAYAGAFTSFANAGPQWLDCASPGINHYGIKWTAEVTPAAIPIDVVLRVHMSFRNKI